MLFTVTADKDEALIVAIKGIKEEESEDGRVV